MTSLESHFKKTFIISFILALLLVVSFSLVGNGQVVPTSTMEKIVHSGDDNFLPQ